MTASTLSFRKLTKFLSLWAVHRDILDNKEPNDAFGCMINTICCIYSNCLLMMNSYSIRNM